MMNFYYCNILYKKKHRYPYTVYTDFQMIFGEAILIKENNINYKKECLPVTLFIVFVCFTSQHEPNEYSFFL